MLNPKLNSQEKNIIFNKGTEPPFSGKYDNFFEDGTYVCRRCQIPLYTSDSKFDAHCGWPSFDQEIKGRVKRLPDADGRRTEIQCATCGAHFSPLFFCQSEGGSKGAFGISDAQAHDIDAGIRLHALVGRL